MIEFILNANWHDFPDEIQHQSKRCLLDTLGAMIAGTQTPVSNTIASLQMGQGNSTLIGSGIKLSSTGAALANGFPPKIFMACQTNFGRKPRQITGRYDLEI